MWLWLAWVWMRIGVWFTRRATNRQSGRARRRLAETVCRRTQTKPAWVTQEAVRLKALMPDAGCRTLARVFNRRFATHAYFRRDGTP